MPTKGSFASNVFEQLEDLGKSTVKATAKAVAQTVNPVKIVGEMISPGKGTPEEAQMEKLKKEAQSKQSSTPLDFGKLTQKYQENDQAKLMAVRKQFNLVVEGTEKAIEIRKKEEEERKRKFAMEEQEKKAKQQQSMQVVEAIPQGKERKTIGMAHKKKAQMQHQETKPSTGKQ